MAGASAPAVFFGARPVGSSPGGATRRSDTIWVCRAFSFLRPSTTFFQCARCRLAHQLHWQCQHVLPRPPAASCEIRIRDRKLLLKTTASLTHGCGRACRKNCHSAV
jgi:hypothetical protein